MKKLLKITGISLLLLVVLAFALPFFFKSKIVAIVKKEVNQNLVATVDFKDVDLSFFRRFPRVSVRLEGVSVVGQGEFSKDTLLSSSSIDAAVNLLSFFKNDMEVYRVDLDAPRIHALVNKGGKANWDIAKPSETTGTADTAGHFSLKLNQYAIHDGYVYYADETLGATAEITGLDHEGKGDFTQDQFTLSTATKTAGASFSYAGIPYLSNNVTSLQSDIVIDANKNAYQFTNTELTINQLKLTTDGSFQLLNDSSYAMDFRFGAPSTDFKELLSLVPALYKADFDNLKTSGKAGFSGFVKGVYSPTQLPAYDVVATVQDGSFQYPELPAPVKNINLSLHASNPDGAPDNAVIDISKAHLEMNGAPVDFHLLYKTPVSAPYVDAALKGRIDLSQIAKFVKLEKGTQLAGLVNADAFAKGSLSALQAKGGAFSAGGFFDVQNLSYAANDFPQPVKNGRVKVTLTNSGRIADQTAIHLSEAHLEVGGNPVDFTLQLTKPVTAMEFSGTAKGSFNLDGVKQFMTLEEGTKLSGATQADLQFSGSKALIDKKAYDQVKLSGTAALQQVFYASKDYPTGIKVSDMQLAFTPQSALLKNLQAAYLKTAFTASGTLDNLLGYVLKDGVLRGNLQVGLDRMNLNEWMGTSTATSSTATASEPFAVPANLNLALHAKAGQVTYDKVAYQNISGTVLLHNETAQLQDVHTDALDGSITFNGSYSTQLSKTTPDINLAYTVSGVDIQKAFYAYNTVQKLMPVGQFLSGKLSSQLSMKGKLKGDLMPDLSSLTGNGSLLLIEGVLKKFAPLDKIAATLGINDLREVSLKELKSYVEFANGKVLVKPFTTKVKDIDMQIGGLHGLDLSMDYLVQMKVPRKYLGASGNNLVNKLNTMAANKGLPVALGEIVNLNIKVGGTVSNPTIGTDLKEAAGDATKAMQAQAVAFAKQKADSAKQTLKDTVAAVKKAVVNDLKDEIRKQVLGGKDSSGAKPLEATKDKAVEKVKGALDGLFKRKKAAADTTQH